MNPVQKNQACSTIRKSLQNQGVVSEDATLNGNDDTLLPDDTVIGEDPDADAERFYVSPNGVVLVTPEMLGQEIHHVR